ncbi:hypothetical protein niasHT_015711 [Heterodera trifolii]|uniref:Uncharacterized protein n=1 Tax=Heterodera trifolii TaxID=157864 RepID=A0ABD2L4F3_9BILA
MNYFSFLILLNIIFLNFGLSSAIEGTASEESGCSRVGFGLFGRISWPNDGTKGAEKKDQWAKWLSVETKATSVSDCVRQCYEYRFCHSVLFEFKTNGASSKKGQCQMFLHASDNCRGEQLTPIYRIEPTLGKPSKVFVECLKCAAFAKEDGTPTTVIFEQLEKPQKIAGKRKSTPNLEIPMVENEEAKERTRKTTGEGRTNAAGAERQLRRRTRQMWRACVVTFEVLPADASEKALQQFRATKTASVSSLNECAFICFQNACLNALFEQSEESERTAKCHLDMETENEICTPGQQRDYSYPNKNGSVISCVRCVATLPSTLEPRTEATTTTTESATTETTIEEEKNATEIGIESETATSMLFSQPMELAGDVRDETEGNGTEKVIETTGEAKIETITQKGITAEEEEEKEEKKEHKETKEEPEFSMDEENQTEKEKETTEESTTVTDRVPTLPILIMNEHQGSEGRPKSVGIAVPSETNPTATTATTEGSEEGEEEEEAQKTRENGTTKAADQPISERKAMLKSEEKVQQQEDDANATTASSSTEETAVTANVEQQEDDANATTASSSTEETAVTAKVEEQEDDANATTGSSSTGETAVTPKVEEQEDDANATTGSSSTGETEVTAKVEEQEDDANATTASSSTGETAVTAKVEEQEDDANATTASSSTGETEVTAKVEEQEDDANATTASSSTGETAVTAKVEEQEDDANATTASSSTGETAVTPKVEHQEDDANATTASSSTGETAVTPKVEHQEDDANATTASSSTGETAVTAKVELQEDDANATTASSSTGETAVTPKVEEQEDDANATTASSSTEETAVTAKLEEQEDDANATTASSSTGETIVTPKVEEQEDDANATTASSSTGETAVTAKVELLENDTNATTASNSTGETAVTPKVELQEDDANATTASSSTEETAVTAKVELLENDANATTSSSSSSSTVPFELPAEGGFESDASSPANNLMNNSQLTDETTAVPFPTEFQNVSSSSPETETTKMTTEEAAADDVVDAVSKFVDIVKMNNSDVANATEPTVKAVASIAQFVVGQNASSTLGFGINECSEDLLFSGQVLKDYTQSFEVILAAETVYDCVHSCYQQNCSRAAFTHFPRSVCLMHFGDEVPLDQKCTEGDRLGTTWDFSSVPEVVEIKCVKCAGRKESVEKSTDSEQNIAKRHFTNDENAVGQQETTARHILNPQGLTLKCDGRVEFVASPVANLHPLNITNDVPADTAADCARKCFEAIHCTLAAFIPTPGHESAGGICLLTSDAGDVACAGTSVRHSPQHASTVPFLIKCIRCSRCHYALTLLDTQRSAALMPAEDHFEQTVPVRTVGECAEKCAGQGTNCSRAQFDPNKSTCSFSTSKNALRGYSAECPAESGVQSDGIFPLLLDCVKCFGNNSNSEAQQNK